jgi:predicted aspartyl protease
LWASAVAYLLCWSATASAAPAIPTGWEKQDVNLRLPGGRQIKAIYHPTDKAPRMMKDDKEPVQHEKKYLYPLRQTTPSATGQLSLVATDIIDSPPIDGFVPYVAVTVTNESGSSDDWVAVAQPAITGSFLTLSPLSNYAIGLLDTGAAASLIGYNDATTLGIYAQNLVTVTPVGLGGAVGTVTALDSYPLATFIDSLAAIGTNGLLTTTAGMRGESNVCVVVGDVPASGSPDLPTAIGAPLAVFYTSVFDNGHKVTRTRGGIEYRAPDIKLYEPGDPAIPEYNDSTIPLEIRPDSESGVNYFGIDISTGDSYPQGPSVIGDGVFSQSAFFVSSVDLADAGHSAIDRTKFMLDTGAQVTVVGTAVGARLALATAHPDFQVEITDVTGQTVMEPGFYLDSVQIPALNGWYSATNVPVIMMNVDSPEGSFLDGIIGMNLFTSYNMVLKGGAFSDSPELDIKFITDVADISPTGGDGKVNMLDLYTLAAAWLATPGSENWNAAADIAPDGGDGIVNFRDFAALAANWDWVRGQ